MEYGMSQAFARHRLYIKNNSASMNPRFFTNRVVTMKASYFMISMFSLSEPATPTSCEDISRLIYTADVN
jgi:hypothetical protein